MARSGRHPSGAEGSRCKAGRWLALVAAGLVASAFLLGSVPASAAEYTVWSCRGPDGGALSTEAWRVQVNDAQPGDIEVTDSCASGGSLRIGVTDAGIPNNRKPIGQAFFELPRGAAIAGYRVWRSIYAAAYFAGGPVHSYAAAIREWSGGSTFDSGCASQLLLPSFNCSFWGSPSEPFGPENLATEFSAPLDGLSFWAACLSVGCETPFVSPSAEFRLFRSAVEVEDNVAPVVERVGGSIAEGEPVSGIAHLDLDASDQGGGVASFALSIDGAAPRRAAAGAAQGTCSEPYVRAMPCPVEASRGFAVNTAELTEGAHTAAGEVIDAAGNATPFGPLPFVVERRGAGGETPNNGTPATALPRLQLRPVPPQHKPGRPAGLRGVLTTPAGVPIAGAVLGASFVEQGERKARSRKLPAVKTDENGRFGLRLRGAGARTVTVSYSPVLGGPATRVATALVRARLTLTLTHRPRRARAGQPVRFSGQLQGAGAAARGTGIEIQARVDGAWRPVASVTANRAGRFRWTYSFRYVERNAIFSFRAVVRRSLGWPWPTVKSRRLAVIVDGAPR